MDTKRIDFNLLVALDVLIAERNVTKAARRLNLSQPALSAQLNRLRDLFSDQLLIPAQRGMIPTQRALELQEPLRQALEGVRSVVAEQVAFDPVNVEITIAIAASDYVQYALLMPLTSALQREAPKIRIAWRPIDGRTLHTQMERGEVDLGIMTPDTAPDQLRSRKLFDERYVVIVRRNHPTVRRTLDLNSFCALDHVIVSPRGGGFTGATDTALEALGRTRKVALSIASFLMAPEIIACSDMIALVPERLVWDRTDHLQILEPPLPVAGFAIAVFWHDRTTAHPAQRWLRERVVAAAAGRTGRPIIRP
jgi:DNA-binding transcriptional LysR family regulator